MGDRLARRRWLARLGQRLLRPPPVACRGRLLGPRVLSRGRHAARVARIRDTHAASRAAAAAPATTPAAASTAWLAALARFGGRFRSWQGNDGRQRSCRRLFPPWHGRGLARALGRSVAAFPVAVAVAIAVAGFMITAGAIGPARRTPVIGPTAIAAWIGAVAALGMFVAWGGCAGGGLTRTCGGRGRVACEESLLAGP